ncbi:hypothetical protein JCM10213_008295 [Rhodosporidiobolus nylandii]
MAGSWLCGGLQTGLSGPVKFAWDAMDKSQKGQAELPKKKKPPACDRCKAKRVLCHPNPAGCPRCIEKGVECTTTPVVRRKPQKRTARSTPAPPSAAPLAHTAADFAASEDVAAGNSGSTFLVSSADPPPSLAPVASTSQIPYAAVPRILPSPAQAAPSSLDALRASTTVSQHAVQGGPGVLPHEVTPELMKHFYHCYEQSPFFDHIIFRGFSVRGMLESVKWDIARLSSQHRVLAYCICAIAALFSFDPIILGDAPRPSSFLEITPGDLREFGRRREAACSRMSEAAEKLAKKQDVAFECSIENAASCMLLDALSKWDAGARNTSRPWMSAYLSHVRSLIDTADTTNSDAFHPNMWAIHLSTDVVSEIDSGRLTSTYADQIALTGRDVPDAVALEKSLQETLKGPIEKGWWPECSGILMLYLDTARSLTEKVLGTHARREPLDHGVVSDFLVKLDRLRSISTSFAAIAGRLYEGPLAKRFFPHAVPRKRRWTQNLALSGLRHLASWAASSLVLPLHRELERRWRLAKEKEGELASKGETRDLSARQAIERLEMSRRHVRELLLLAIERKLEDIENAPHLAAFATMRRLQLVHWVVAFLELVESGEVLMEEKYARQMDQFSSILKTAGYCFSSLEIDDLILRLESNALAFRLAQNATSSQSSNLALPAAAPSFWQQPIHSTFPTDLSLMSAHSDPLAQTATAAARSFDLSFASLVPMSRPDSPTSTPADAFHAENGDAASAAQAQATEDTATAQFASLDPSLAGLAREATGGEGWMDAAGLGLAEWGLW